MRNKYLATGIILFFDLIFNISSVMAAKIPRDLVGWTVVEIVTVREDSGTIGFDRILTIDNGQKLHVVGIGLPILPLSEGILFGKKIDAVYPEVQGKPKAATSNIIMLKLLIDDTEYDVTLTH